MCIDIFIYLFHEEYLLMEVYVRFKNYCTDEIQGYEFTVSIIPLLLRVSNAILLIV